MEVQTALIRLLDHQGDRRVKAFELALQSDGEQVGLDRATKEESAQEDRRALTREAWIEFAKWLAPAGFACLLGWWMVQFFRAGNREAGLAVREFLRLMAGGALGWIARKS